MTLYQCIKFRRHNIIIRFITTNVYVIIDTNNRATAHLSASGITTPQSNVRTIFRINIAISSIVPR